MTATIIDVHTDREDVRFHCPVTGQLIFSAYEQSFEQCTSPYFLALLTSEGVFHCRTGDIPDAHIDAIGSVIESLHWRDPGSMGMGAHDMKFHVPNVIAGMLPDTTVIFDIQAVGGIHDPDLSDYVFMDFSLPDAQVEPERDIHDPVHLVPHA